MCADVAKKLLLEFDKALDDEITEVKKRSGTSTVRIFDGRLVGEVSGENIYEFTAKQPQKILDESDATVELGGNLYKAVVASCQEYKLVLRISGLKEREIPQAVLKIEATFVLRKLREALSDLADFEDRLEMVEAVFGLRPGKGIAESPPFFLRDARGREPDEFQKEAINACFSHSVSFVHGPPGTGKTRTLVGLLVALVAADRRVLVVCHTNIACDNVVKNCLRFKRTKAMKTLLSQRGLVRVGTPVLQDKEVRALAFDELFEEAAKELLEEQHILIAQKKHLQHELGAVKGTLLDDESKEILKEIADIDAELADITDKLVGKREQVLKNAHVVVSTLSRCFLGKALDQFVELGFDAVVLDEASIAPLPMVFYAASLAGERVCIFGDPKQLPPIATADTPATAAWLKRDIYTAAKAGGASTNGVANVHLDKQYRMHDDIHDIVNNLFYGGRLINARGRTDEPDPKISFGKTGNVLLFDSAQANAPSGIDGRSHNNLYHALVVENMLLHLLKKRGLGEEDIGVITPYRSQANLLRDMLARNELRNVDVGTVHTFQGIEKTVIIVDLVEAPNKARVGPLLDDQHYMNRSGSVNDALRLLTVACSRPKDALLIVGDSTQFLGKLRDESTLKQLIASLLNRGAVVDTTTLVPVYADEGFSKKVSPKGDGTRKSLYPKLLADLQKASANVLIISGAVTAERFADMLPIFKQLIKKKVKIRLVLPEPGNGKGEELKAKLAEKGIETTYHPVTDERFVVIDGKISYIGTLDVLSHNNRPTAMMARSERGESLMLAFRRLVRRNPELTGVCNEAVLSAIKTVPDCPLCMSRMTLREGIYGKFYGCSKYPACTGTRELL